MRRIKYRMSLDMFEVASQTTIKAKKGDTACSIHVTLTENGKIYHIVDGCHAVFSGKKPDGNYLFNGETCRIKDNTIIYDFTEQTTPVEGIVECEVILFKDEQRLTSPRFNLKVDNTVYNGEEIVSTPEVDALKDLTDRAENIVAQFDDGVIVGKEYVDNNFANALKGSASGNAIPIMDISPVPHKIKVDVEIPKYKTVVEKDALASETISFEPITNWVITTNLVNEGLILNLEDGSEWHSYGALEITSGARYIKVEYQNGVVTQYFYSDAAMTDLYSSYTNETTLSSLVGIGFWEDMHIKVETKFEGSVSVDVYGKNLLSHSKHGQTYELNGITYYGNEDGSIKVTGVATSTSTVVLNGSSLKNRLKDGVTYKISPNKGGVYMYIYYKDESGAEKYANSTITWSKDYTFKQCYLQLTKSSAERNVTFYPQVEVGTTATAYEPYKAPETYVANDDGTVDVDYENSFMTLLSDSKMDVEYNRDINKAFAEIQQVIAQLQTLAVATVPLNEGV